LRTASRPKRLTSTATAFSTLSAGTAITGWRQPANRGGIGGLFLGYNLFEKNVAFALETACKVRLAVTTAVNKSDNITLALTFNSRAAVLRGQRVTPQGQRFRIIFQLPFNFSQRPAAAFVR
jgi:hypothetical protein